MAFEEFNPNDRLRLARLRKDLTQEELAEKIGAAPKTIHRWERGRGTPSSYYRKKLCEVLEASNEELGLLQGDISEASDPCVFLSSTYDDAGQKFVASLLRELRSRSNVVRSTRSVKKQLEEVIRAARVILLIVSSKTQASPSVHETLDIATFHKRPIFAIWIEGEDWQKCAPTNYSETPPSFDARAGDAQLLLNKILSQLEQTWLTTSDPEIAGLSEPMWKVPAVLTPLLGREKELSNACQLLQRPEVRLLSLVGVGGIGKTQLGLQVAVEMRGYFADGICFVRLETITDYKLVIPTIAAAFGIRETTEQSLFEQVQMVLKNKHFLLLLDNFEQVQSASPQLLELLSVCAHLKLLVTSRARLDVRGAYYLQVPPLALPDLTQLPEANLLSQYAAVALFIERAQAVMSTFEVTQANAREIAEVCVRLDGLPLAIELVAPRIRSSSWQDLLKRLEHPFDIKKTGRGREPRQYTLRNTFSWSYTQLNDEEQRLFRLLSTFVGGCTLEIVEAICRSMGDMTLNVWDSVESLLDNNLLDSTEQEGERRLQFLGIIREYGLECLAENKEQEATREAHARYYLELVEVAELHFKGPQQSLWLKRFMREYRNLRAAFDWFIDHEEAELALRFSGALWRFWYLCGYWSEGRHWLRTALEFGQTKEPTAARAKALFSAGDLAYYQDEFEVARPLLEESITLCRTLGMSKELAIALSALGVLLHADDANPQLIDRLLEESETLCRIPDNDWELAYVLRKLGQIASQRRDLKSAVRYALEGLALAQRLEDTSLIATTFGTLADIAAHENDLVQAISYYEQSLELAQKLGDKSLTAVALQNLAYYMALQGKPIDAASYGQKSLALVRELGDRLFITTALHTLGYVTARQGNLEEAAKHYHEGLFLAQEMGNEAQVGWHLFGLAILADARKQPIRTVRLLSSVEKRLILVEMNTAELAEYEQLKENMRTQLDEAPFANAWAEGLSMTPEEIMNTPEPPTKP